MKLLIVLATLLPLSLMAEEDKKLGWAHNSGLGYVVNGGNSESETFNFKQATSYAYEMSIYKWTGNYVASKATDQTTEKSTQSAENWATLLRYERVMSPVFNVYVQGGIAGDRFQNLRERKTGGIGGKYITIKTETFEWVKEIGYEYARELYTQQPNPGELIHQEFHFARAFTQADYKMKKDLQVGVKVEYLYPFADQKLSISGQKDTADYRVNFSPYLTTVLSDYLSLQLAYEGRYRNVPVVAGNKYLDFTFTTTLLATY